MLEFPVLIFREPKYLFKWYRFHSIFFLICFFHEHMNLWVRNRSIILFSLWYVSVLQIFFKNIIDCSYSKSSFRLFIFYLLRSLSSFQYVHTSSKQEFQEQILRSWRIFCHKTVIVSYVYQIFLNAKKSRREIRTKREEKCYKMVTCVLRRKARATTKI